MKELQEIADLFSEIRQERLELSKKVQQLEKKEANLKSHLIADLKQSGLGVVGGARTKTVVTLTTKVKAKVENWEDLYGYIYETRGWDLLHRRLTESAVQAREDAGESVPGVSKVETDDISITNRS